MTQRECYEKIGANYDEMIGRSRSEERIDKYLNMFMRDTTLEDLEKAMEKQDYKRAYIAVHTLKSVSANMWFTNLNRLAVRVTVLLHEDSIDPEGARALMRELKDEYEKTKRVVGNYLEGTSRI